LSEHTLPTDQNQAGIGGLDFDANRAAMRHGQAQLLRQRTPSSCLIVQAVVVYLAALIFFTGDRAFALIWLLAASSMVLITWAYAKLRAPNGVSPAQTRSYLRWHVVVSCCTGVVWGLMACLYLDPDRIATQFIAVNMVVAITLGGLLPSAEYRPTFIGLFSFVILPLAVWWLITIPGATRLVGVGLLIYFGFGLLVSARAELGSLEAIAARNSQELIARLRQQYDVAQRASAEKSRFMAAASHDMAQPLQAQAFFLRTLRTHIKDADALNLLEQAQSCARTQGEMLRAMTETARLDSGAVTTRLVAFDLERLIQQLVEEFEASLNAKSLAIDLQTSPAPVHSDPRLVARILRNLLSNAVKFSSPQGRIGMRLTAEGETVRLTIDDEGPGIPAGQQELIFEEYVQLDNPNRDFSKGLGLGLAIVRQLVALLGLQLELTSAPGSGTSATLTLPRHEGPLEPLKPIMDRLGEFGTNPLIVFIEDNRDVRDATSALLTEWGCKLICAQSRNEALALLQYAPETPDLLLVDKRLANHDDGLSVIDALREELNADIPALLFTGDISEFQALRDAPNVSVIQKPAEPLELHRAIAALTGG
jgi:signal transduction histidine kinase